MSDTLLQARELLEQQNFQEALDLLNTVSPIDSVVKTSIARALSGLGRWEQAGSLFSEVIKQDPDYHEAYAGRGLLYFLSGGFAEAHADYVKALEKAPKNGRYYGLMGVLLAQVGEAVEALKAFDAAYKLGCHDTAFILSAAQLHLAMRNPEHAQAALSLAEKHGAEEGAIAALEGSLSMLKGDPKEALASFRFAVDKAPGEINNWMNMLTLTAQLERGRLLEEAQRALKALPDSPEIIQVAVGAYREAGQLKEAFKVLREAIKRNPESPLLHFHLGLGYAYSEKFEKAVEAFTEALKYAPRFPRALDARGNCYERLGKKDEARADFEKSHEIRQEDAEKQAVRRQMVEPSGNGAD